MIIYHNGSFAQDTFVLSLHDRLRLGEGVFNTMLAIDGKVIHAQAHMEKMLKNSKLFWGDWAMPSVNELVSAAHELLQQNSFRTGRHALNTLITGGPAGGGLRPPENFMPQILMRAMPLNISSDPINAIISQTTRRNEGSPLSNIKYSNYGDHILALHEAASKGANEALLLNNKGNVVCATSANIVIVQDGKLYTPPLSDGAQDGMTRGILMAKGGMTEKSFTPDELKAAQGAYIINSLRGAVAIASLDGSALPEPALKIKQDLHIV
jgi:branched-subunit amino acid aminotransferase/4-amino-4-deoxychorismate lyase